MLKKYVIFYFSFCIIAAILEWSYGAYWDMVGNTPWLYYDSFLRYTTLEMLPLWGFGGLIGVAVWNSIMLLSAKPLLLAVIPLILSALWILIHAQFIA